MQATRARGYIGVNIVHIEICVSPLVPRSKSTKSHPFLEQPGYGFEMTDQGIFEAQNMPASKPPAAGTGNSKGQTCWLANEIRISHDRLIDTWNLLKIHHNSSPMSIWMFLMGSIRPKITNCPAMPPVSLYGLVPATPGRHQWHLQFWTARALGGCHCQVSGDLWRAVAARSGNAPCQQQVVSLNMSASYHFTSQLFVCFERAGERTHCQIMSFGSGLLNYTFSAVGTTHCSAL